MQLKVDNLDKQKILLRKDSQMKRKHDKRMRVLHINSLLDDNVLYFIRNDALFDTQQNEACDFVQRFAPVETFTSF